MTAVTEPTITLDDLETTLWESAGPEFAGISDMEGDSNESAVRDYLFGQAIMHLAAARLRQPPEVTGPAIARRHYMVVKALRNGKSPLATLHGDRQPDDEVDEQQLVAAAGKFLRRLTDEPEVTTTKEQVKSLRRSAPTPPEWDLDDSLNTIVAAAVKDVAGAKERLITEIHPLIQRYCRSRLGSKETGGISAQDVAQEVCLAVIKALPGYVLRGLSFHAFVYGIAAHKVIDAYRAVGRNRAEPVDILPEKQTAEPGPEAVCIGIELSQEIESLLSVLTPRKRDILVLRIMMGFSAEKTAEIVGSTPGAVRVTQHRALNRLREVIEGSGAPVSRELRQLADQFVEYNQ